MTRQDKIVAFAVPKRFALIISDKYCFARMGWGVESVLRPVY